MGSCYMCHEKGLIEMRHKKTKGTHAFRCECFLGDKYSSYPIWKRIMAIDYEPLFDEKDISENGKVLRGSFGAKNFEHSQDQSNIQETEVDFELFE